MGRTCSAHAGDEKWVQTFGLKGGNRLEDLDITGRIILKWVAGK
jgi:hypothetical protein